MQYWIRYIDVTDPDDYMGWVVTQGPVCPVIFSTNAAAAATCYAEHMSTIWPHVTYEVHEVTDMDRVLLRETPVIAVYEGGQAVPVKQVASQP